MGNEIKKINDKFWPSDNQKNNNKIENSEMIYDKSIKINSFNEDELFNIKGFRQHYILNIANLANKNVIILGDSKIGKTKIFNIIFEKEHLNENINENDYHKNSSEHNYAYFEEKNFVIEGLEININIWDTPGEEKHYEANKHFIKDCIIMYLCFHFKSPKSFELIKNYYIKTIKEINGKNSFIVLVGIKNEMFDDENANDIPASTIKKFAEENNFFFYSVCLSDSNSVRYLFNDSIKKYVLLNSKISFRKKI